MEDHEKVIIRKQLPKLIENMKCSTYLLAHLQQSKSLGLSDVEQLDATKCDSPKTELLLRILMTRKGGFSSLFKALKKTHQSGALALLQDNKGKGTADKKTDFSGDKRRKCTCNSVCIFLMLSGALAGMYMHYIIFPLNDLAVNCKPLQVPENYILRSLVSRRKLSNSIFLDNDTDDIYAFQGIQSYVLAPYLPSGELLATSQELIRDNSSSTRYIKLQSINHFDRISVLKPRQSVHWIVYKDKHFYWKKSTRNDITAILKSLASTNEQTLITEEAFIISLSSPGNTENVVIIADSPGMGKSLLLASLRNNLCKDGNSVLFFGSSKFTNIYRHSEIYNESMDILLVLDSLIRYGNLRDVHAPDFKSVLKDETANLFIFVDGYDEIVEMDRQTLDKVLLVLSSHSNIRLIVSSRLHLMTHLENLFKTIAYNIAPFSEESQVTYLYSRWSNVARKQNFTLDPVQLKIFVGKQVKSLQILQPGNHSNLHIGSIPLHCSLLAELLEMDAIEYSDPSKTIENETLLLPGFTSIRGLFDDVIERKLQIYQSKNLQTITLEISSVKWAHFYYAMTNIYPGYIESFVRSKIPLIDLENLIGIGILEMKSSDELQFVHMSFVDYFITWGIFEEITVGQDQQVKSELLNFLYIILLNTHFRFDEMFNTAVPDFNNTLSAHFVNSFLNGVSISKELEIALCTNKPVLKGPQFSALLVSGSAAVNDFPNIADQLFSAKCISKDVTDTEAIIGLFQLAALKAGAKFISIMVGLLEDSVYKQTMYNFEWHDRDMDIPINVLDHVAHRGHFSAFHTLYRTMNYKHRFLSDSFLESNMVHYSCLHQSLKDDVPIIHEKIQIIRFLLEEHSQMLQTTSYLNIPPQLLPNIHPELLIELSKHSAFNYFLVDVLGNTFLHTSAEYLNSQQYDYLLQNIPTEILEKILRIKNIFGQTPLHKFIGSLHGDPYNTTLSLMLKYSGNINDLDHYNKSILLTAILFQRSIPCIEFLIKNGADWKTIRKDSGHILGSALHYAMAWNPNIEISQYFIYLDMNLVHRKDFEGRTPLFYALLDYDFFDPHKIPEKDCTWIPITQVEKSVRPLSFDMKQKHFLTIANHYKKSVTDEFVKLLLQYEADPTVLDNEGNTALQFAFKNGYPGNLNSIYLLAELAEFKHSNNVIKHMDKLLELEAEDKTFEEMEHIWKDAAEKLQSAIRKRRYRQRIDMTIIAVVTIAFTWLFRNYPNLHLNVLPNSLNNLFFFLNLVMTILMLYFILAMWISWVRWVQFPPWNVTIVFF